jgi:hypothetical protein
MQDLVPQRRHEVGLFLLWRIDRQTGLDVSHCSNVTMRHSRRGETPDFGLLSLHLVTLSLGVSRNEVR